MTLTLPVLDNRITYIDETASVKGTPIKNVDLQNRSSQAEKHTYFEFAHLFEKFGYLQEPVITNPSNLRLTLAAGCRFIAEKLGFWQCPQDTSLDFYSLIPGQEVNRWDGVYLELFRHNDNAEASNLGKIGYRINYYAGIAGNGDGGDLPIDIDTQYTRTTLERDLNKEELHTWFALCKVHRYQTAGSPETNFESIVEYPIASSLSADSYDLDDLTVETITFRDSSDVVKGQLYNNNTIFQFRNADDTDYANIQAASAQLETLNMFWSSDVPSPNINMMCEDAAGKALGFYMKKGSTFKFQLEYDSDTDNILLGSFGGAEIYLNQDGSMDLSSFGAGNDITLDSANDLNLEATNDVVIAPTGKIDLNSGSNIEAECTDFTITRSGSNPNIILYGDSSSRSPYVYFKNTSTTRGAVGFDGSTMNMTLKTLVADYDIDLITSGTGELTFNNDGSDILNVNPTGSITLTSPVSNAYLNLNAATNKDSEIWGKEASSYKWILGNDASENHIHITNYTSSDKFLLPDTGGFAFNNGSDDVLTISSTGTIGTGVTDGDINIFGNGSGHINIGNDSTGAHLNFDCPAGTANSINWYDNGSKEFYFEHYNNYLRFGVQGLSDMFKMQTNGEVDLTSGNSNNINLNSAGDIDLDADFVDSCDSVGMSSTKVYKGLCGSLTNSTPSGYLRINTNIDWENDYDMFRVNVKGYSTSQMTLDIDIGGYARAGTFDDVLYQAVVNKGAVTHKVQAAKDASGKLVFLIGESTDGHFYHTYEVAELEACYSYFTDADALGWTMEINASTTGLTQLTELTKRGVWAVGSEVYWNVNGTEYKKSASNYYGGGAVTAATVNLTADDFKGVETLYILANPASNVITINLPDAYTVIGKKLRVYSGSSSYAVDVTPYSGDSIYFDGSLYTTKAQLATANEWITLSFNNTNVATCERHYGAVFS